MRKFDLDYNKIEAFEYSMKEIRIKLVRGMKMSWDLILSMKPKDIAKSIKEFDNNEKRR